MFTLEDVLVRKKNYTLNMVENTKYLKLNEILSYVAKFGITDDSYRGIKIEESSKNTINELLRIYMEYGDMVWEYLLDEDIIATPDEFYYELSAFASACNIARGHTEDMNNPKSIHYQPD